MAEKKARKKKKTRASADVDVDVERPALETVGTSATHDSSRIIVVDNECEDIDGGVPSPIAYDDDGVVVVTSSNNNNDNDDGGNMFTDDGLVVATAIESNLNDEYIYSAIEYDPDSKPPMYTNRRFRTYSCLALLLVAAVISIVVVYVTRGVKGPEYVETEVLWDGEPTMSPSNNPTSDRMTSGIREQLETGVLLRDGNFTTMELDDPRYLALDWILHNDDLQLESDDPTLYQRYVLALLAYALDSLAWEYCGDHRRVTNVTMVEYEIEDCEVTESNTELVLQKKVWLSSTLECEWYGVICSEDGVVRGLELIGNGLIGDIPPEISQLRFLQYLALNGNCLYGTIPPEFGKMSNLLSLELHGNGLSGILPIEMYDADKLQLLNVAMQYGYASRCVMSNGTVVDTLWRRGGVVEYEVNYGLEGEVMGFDVGRWSSMKGLHLFDNNFGGEMNETLGDLKYLVFLRAQNNLFSGYIPGGITRLNKLRELHLNTNYLLSDLPPDIGSMEDLEDLKVNENPMFGSIPDSLYDLAKLKLLWLQDTVHCVKVEGDPSDVNCEVDMDYGFEGSIRTEIGNLTKLEMLLLNNNPLTGTIPTEIGYCEDLAVLHIHNTYIGGSAPIELCLLRDKKLNSETGVGVFYADCRPNNRTEDPFFSCDCCTDCCDHTTGVCIADD